MEDKNYESIIEGILFTMGDSVEPEKMAAALEIDKKEVISIIENLQKKYEEEDRGIRITELDGSYQMCTNTEIYDYLIKLAKQPRKYVLTDTILETLSIVALALPGASDTSFITGFIASLHSNPL